MNLNLKEYFCIYLHNCRIEVYNFKAIIYMLIYGSFITRYQIWISHSANLPEHNYSCCKFPIMIQVPVHSQMLHIPIPIFQFPILVCLAWGIVGLPGLTIFATYWLHIKNFGILSKNCC